MTIRGAEPGDIAACVEMIEARRALYETFQPRFWKKAGHSAAMSQAFFGHMASDGQTLFLVSDVDGVLNGFLVAANAPNPPVYDIGGRTALIDDYCVADPALFPTVGAALLAEARTRLKAAGFVQFVVVSAIRDDARTRFLEAEGLSPAASWWTSGL